MKRLNIFPRSVGDVVELRVKPNARFVSFAVFVRKHTSAGHHTESSHPPGANGEIKVLLTLAACKGYDLIFVGVPAPSGGASIRYEIAFNAPLAGTLSNPVAITQSTPVVGWTLVL